MVIIFHFGFILGFYLFPAIQTLRICSVPSQNCRQNCRIGPNLNLSNMEYHRTDGYLSEILFWGGERLSGVSLMCHFTKHSRRSPNNSSMLMRLPEKVVAKNISKTCYLRQNRELSSFQITSMVSRCIVTSVSIKDDYNWKCVDMCKGHWCSKACVKKRKTPCFTHSNGKKNKTEIQ